MAKIKVQITVDEELLNKIDDYADDNYTSRSSVFVQGAAQIVNQASLIAAVKNMSLAMRKIADTGIVTPDELKQLEDFERAASYLVQLK